MQKQFARRRKISLWLDRKSERHVQIMAALFFCGCFLVFIYGFKTLATWSQISQIYFGLAVILSFLPISWLPFIYRIRKELKVILGIFALAPFFTGMVLLLNFYITFDQNTQVFKATGCKVDYNDQIVLIEVENESINKHIEIRKFPLKRNRVEPDSVAFVINHGIFGLNTVHEAWIIPKK